MDQSKKNYNSIMNEIYQTVHLLYCSINIETKNTLLRRLKAQLSRLSQLFNLTLQEDELDDAIPVQGQPDVFTKSELLTYDGMHGNPAYVAVNGIVYDVTNNSAWAAATHFGLKAGTDVTAAFVSCHADQDILSKLKPIGRLQNDRLL